MGNANVLGLRAIDRIPQDPSAGSTMRRHAPPAKVADPTGRDAGDEHEISWVNGDDARADRLDHAHALVSEDAPGSHTRNVALQDVKVGSANGRSGHSNDRVTAVTNGRPGCGLPRSLAGAAVDQCLHDAVRAHIARRPIRNGFNTLHGSFPRRG